MMYRLALFCTLLLLFVGAVATTLVRAETVTIQRVVEVPADATLTYSVGGRVLQSMTLPVGTARITIQLTSPSTIRLGHGRRR